MRKLMMTGALAMAFTSTIAQTVSKDLSVQEFQQKLSESNGAVLLDLRTPEEVAQGTIEGSINIDYFAKDFEEKITALDRSKTYFIFCASGGRSGETKELMSEKGFKMVYTMPAGFTGWKKAKMPVKI